MESLLSLLRMHWDREPPLFLVGADVRRLTYISDGNQSLLTSAPTRFIESTTTGYLELRTCLNI